MLVRMWGKGTLVCCWCECKLIPLLGIHLKECESSYNKDTCTPMFFAALFTIAKPRETVKMPHY
jgi:hypothetical protein